MDIQAGEFHTVALRNHGRVYAFGYNGQGQLGIGTTTDSATAVQVSGITDAVAIAVGRNHTLVLLSGGTVKAFGGNGSGQLGDNSTTDRTSPVTVVHFKQGHFAALVEERAGRFRFDDPLSA